MKRITFTCNYYSVISLCGHLNSNDRTLIISDKNTNAYLIYQIYL